MQILFLIPPSEGKSIHGSFRDEFLTFTYEKPLELASKCTPKDLKCIGKRYAEAQNLNENILRGPFAHAIERYNGIMYSGIDYPSMSQSGRTYFDEHCIILSGMYGMLKSQDRISNYKLPIEAKGLSTYWKKTITHNINALNPRYIINLLPISYMKMIDWESIQSTVIPVKFKQKTGIPLTHNMKKIKGEWIRNICEHPNLLQPLLVQQEIIVLES